MGKAVLKIISMKKLTKAAALKHLAAIFGKNGYVRYCDQDKRAEIGGRKYKKGSELRLIVQTEEELEFLQQCLFIAGFKYGKSYEQFRQIRLPIYGKNQVKSFLDLVVTQK